LPGVGSAGATMQSLRDLGILSFLEETVLQRKTLFLGVCVGMQILFEHSQEEDADCLGWLRGEVVKFDSSKVRVPQMGWNEVQFDIHKPIKAKTDYFYFVNSYYARPAGESAVWGIAEYDGPFVAAVCKDNIYGTQFHIEKSGEAGLALLKAFLSLEKGG
jgi:glutamine amidotransferase